MAKNHDIKFKDRPIVIWAKKNAPNIVGGLLEAFGKLTGRKLIAEIGKLIKESDDLTPEQKAEALKLNKI